MFHVFFISNLFWFKRFQTKPVADKCDLLLSLLHCRPSDCRCNQNIPICVKLVSLEKSSLSPCSLVCHRPWSHEAKQKVLGEIISPFCSFMSILYAEGDKIWWHSCTALLFPQRKKVSSYNHLLWNKRKEDVSLFTFDLLEKKNC